MACKMDFLACNGMCENGNVPCKMEACELWDGDYSDCHDYRNTDYQDFMDDRN